MRVRTLSLWQPYATAIDVGAKEIETRGRNTYCTGLIAIHAAARKSGDLREKFDELMGMGKIQSKFLDALQFGYDSLPYGQIICLAELVDSVRVDMLSKISPEERALGDYSPGRYGWVLRNVIRIHPIPWKGKQGFFWSEIPDHFIPKQNLLELARK